MSGITLKEFIEEMQEFAKSYGENVEVVIVTDDGDASPTISGGPDKDGTIRVRLQ